MTNHYALLIKKQLNDSLPTRSAKGRKFNDFSGVLLSGILVAIIIATFVFIFSKFTSTYTAIKINRVPDVTARQYEIMAIAYFALLIICIISGLNRLCYTLFENSDINILISMPFSATEIFLSKLTGVYLRQVLLSMLFVLPINFTFFVTTDMVTAYNVCMTFIVALVLPILPLGIASALVLPYFYVKRFIMTHYALAFFAVTAFMTAFCVLYAYFFELAEGLVDGGKLLSFFNEKTMTSIAAFAKYSYPSNLFANIMLQKDLGKSIGILVGILAISAIVGTMLTRAIFIRVSQEGISPYVPHVAKKKMILKRKPRLLSLLAKEFITILRTPGYSFMYFTTAIIMPVMAYYSARLSVSVLSTLIGDVRVGFEICTFILLLYGTLTNTSCSTAISRDGYMSMTQKTLPYSPAQVLSAKMILGGLTSLVSIAAGCIAFAATGLETTLEAFVTFISAAFMAAAQLAFSIRLDLNHPHFSKTDDGEIKEANTTVSVIILTGLAICFAIGLLLLSGAISGLIRGEGVDINVGISYAIAICIPLALLAASLTFFFVRLKRKYANLDAEV